MIITSRSFLFASVSFTDLPASATGICSTFSVVCLFATLGRFLVNISIWGFCCEAAGFAPIFDRTQREMSLECVLDKCLPGCKLQSLRQEQLKYKARGLAESWKKNA